MPRSYDGPIPQRPERNQLGDRLDDLFNSIGPNRTGDGNPVRDSVLGPRLSDFGDRGDQVRTPPVFELPQQGQHLSHGDNDAPSSNTRVALPAEFTAERAADDAGAQRNFTPDAGDDGAQFAPRQGVHDLLKTHEFHHDWIFP